MELDINIVDIPSLYASTKRANIHIDYMKLMKALPNLRTTVGFDDANAKITTEAFMAVDDSFEKQQPFIKALRTFGYKLNTADFRLTRYEQVGADGDTEDIESLSDSICTKLGMMEGYARATNTEATAVVISNDLRLRRTLLQFATDKTSPFFDNIVLAFYSAGLDDGWADLIEPAGVISFYDLRHSPGVLTNRPPRPSRY